MKTLLTLCTLIVLSGCGGSASILPAVTTLVSLSASSSSISESSASTITLTATLSQIADESVTVSFSTSGAATSGTDYTTLSNITIAAGDTTGTASFSTIDDAIYEGDEVATVAISTVSGGGATENGSQSVSITMTDNESAPTVALSASSSSISESSSSTITLTATLSQIVDEAVVVSFSTSGDATSGTDYVAISNITIAAGSATGTTTFTPTDDAIYEGNEGATVAISSVSGGGATESGSQSVSITITDDESAPTVSLAASGSSVYDSGSNLTITATSTQISDANITVVIGTSGTATEGNDYGYISDITIAAGAITGTAIFNPISDSVNEGSESATVSITSTVGADSSVSGTTSVTITITEHPLNTGTQLIYSSSLAAALSASDEFQFFNGIGAASSQNPLEVINAHKAYGYGLTGSGTQIAILDSGFWADHEEMDGKTITTYGTIQAASASDDHGLFVASVAAGVDDEWGIQGVAPSASLHISDYTQLNGNTYFPTHWANATNDASSAVVQNNSWGIDYQVDTLKSDIVANGWTNDHGVAQKWNSSGFTANDASATSYITALNNFQNHGVIVYALSNDSTFTDADFQAALPELFPQLNEAWITAINIEITGSSGNEVYTRKSAPCGSTAQYCLGADGWEVKGAAYHSSGGDYYWNSQSGTSFVAPQISGAVAILAEAFPNHTPEQLTDRLLASADNSFFSHTDAVTFGNDVQHGYNAEFGHGILDIYAALNPITTSGYTRVFTGNSNQSSSSFPLGSSRIISSRSLGDSLTKGLAGEVGYAYDSMNGGFSYDMTTRIDMQSIDAPKMNLSSELSKLDSAPNPTETSWKVDFNQVLSKLTDTDTIETKLTLGASTLPVQSFFGSNFDASMNLNDYGTPYLEADEGGIGLGAIYQLEGARIMIGFTGPIQQGDGNVIGSRKSFTASVESGSPTATTMTLMSGFTRDEGSLLGSTGIDAYGLTGAKSDTSFSALKMQSQLAGNLFLTGVATLANTNMTKPTNSFVNSASNVKSVSARLGISKRNLLGNDSVSFVVDQPNRVSSGSMSVNLSNLAENDGTLTYDNKDIDLAPSARQLNYSLTYQKEFNKNARAVFRHMVTKNLNHSQNAKAMSSSLIGMKFNHVTAGLSEDFENGQTSAKISYANKF